ncbi:ferritin-like-domain-containing protein [Amanita rubescens]|nr:ferritin-like-domain-containing protein [Amanita rubescens]
MPNWQDALKIVLYDHLQTALVLEAYTIPIIIKIAKDEMFHLGLAGNMLCAIGGKPALYNSTPEFPSTLFSNNLTLTLAPATKETIKLFVDVEAPMPDGKEDLSVEVLPTYKSIGEFYEGLEILLLQADGILNFQGGSIFQPDSTKKQLDETVYGSLFSIKDARSALKALKRIVEEGEGCSTGTEISHWGIFKKIYENYDLTYYNVVENIDSKDYDSEQFKFYPVMVACDAAYSFLFLTLDKLWQTSDPEERKGIIDNNLKKSMRRVIGRLAQFLVKQQIPDTTPVKYAGPPFRHHKFEGNALADLKLWMKTAVDAYPDSENKDLKDAQAEVETFVNIGNA